MREIINALILIGALLLLLGCAPMSAVLTPQGRAVRVVLQQPAGDCDFLGPVTKRLGANFVGYEQNVETATTIVRNVAAAKGATHLVLSPPRATDKNPWVGSGRCNNCVEVSGVAYRCK